MSPDPMTPRRLVGLMTSAAHADMAPSRRSQAVALLGKRWCVPRRNPDRATRWRSSPTKA